MKTNFKLLTLFAFLGILSCKDDAKKETTKVELTPGINLEFMDKETKPNDDFFRYVNGTWLDNNEIPSDRTRWGSFDELRKKTDEDALTILKSAMDHPASHKLPLAQSQACVANRFLAKNFVLARQNSENSSLF